MLVGVRDGGRTPGRCALRLVPWDRSSHEGMGVLEEVVSTAGEPNMTDAESDKQAHAEIAKANEAMPNPMSDKEFRERAIRIVDDPDEAWARLGLLIAEWRRRNAT